jgi:arginine N-succinyltransferase
LAELLPPMERGPEGTTSPLWDALGRRFTRLDYLQADALSRHDKEFIWRLFPIMPVHASLLPQAVQAIIGQVGPDSIGAKRLLESVGFVDSHRVDPFDGGPHYEADTDEIPLVRDARRGTVRVLDETPAAAPAIVAASHSTAPHFRAVMSEAQLIEGGEVELGRAAYERLGQPSEVLVCRVPSTGTR